MLLYGYVRKHANHPASTTYYSATLDPGTSLASLESGLTFAYLGTNLLAFASLHLALPRAPEDAVSITAYFALNLVAFAALAVSPYVRHCRCTCWCSASAACSALYQHAMFAKSAEEGPTATTEFVFGFALAGFLASMASLVTRSVVTPDGTATLNILGSRWCRCCWAGRASPFGLGTSNWSRELRKSLRRGRKIARRSWSCCCSISRLP